MKHVPRLFFAVSVLFYAAALVQSGDRGTLSVLGSVFLVLGMVNSQRQLRRNRNRQ